MDAANHAPELFPHIRIVMGMVIGLGIARLLTWIAAVVQHPGRAKLYPTHLLWVGSILLELIHFWWWEFALFTVSEWTFGVYFFLILYCITLFLLAALLVPDNIDDYDGYEDFFLSRRKWFFGLFASHSSSISSTPRSRARSTWRCSASNTPSRSPSASSSAPSPSSPPIVGCNSVSWCCTSPIRSRGSTGCFTR